MSRCSPSARLDLHEQEVRVAQGHVGNNSLSTSKHTASRGGEGRTDGLVAVGQ